MRNTGPILKRQVDYAKRILELITKHCYIYKVLNLLNFDYSTWTCSPYFANSFVLNLDIASPVNSSTVDRRKFMFLLATWRFNLDQRISIRFSSGWAIGKNGILISNLPSWNVLAIFWILYVGDGCIRRACCKISSLVFLSLQVNGQSSGIPSHRAIASAILDLFHDAVGRRSCSSRKVLYVVLSKTRTDFRFVSFIAGNTFDWYQWLNTLQSISMW